MTRVAPSTKRTASFFVGQRRRSRNPRHRHEALRDRSDAEPTSNLSAEKLGLKLEATSADHDKPLPSDEPKLSSKQSAALRRQWANLIKRVFKTDPLILPDYNDFSYRRGRFRKLWVLIVHSRKRGSRSFH